MRGLNPQHTSVSGEFGKRVGFAGLGIMGSGMSMNTLKAVLPLTIRNRTRSKVLLDAGAEGAGSSRRAMVRICLPKIDLLELVLAT